MHLVRSHRQREQHSWPTLLAQTSKGREGARGDEVLVGHRYAAGSWQPAALGNTGRVLVSTGARKAPQEPKESCDR